MVQIQIRLTEKANYNVKLYQVINKLKTKRIAIIKILEQLEIQQRGV